VKTTWVLLWAWVLAGCPSAELAGEGEGEIDPNGYQLCPTPSDRVCETVDGGSSCPAAPPDVSTVCEPVQIHCTYCSDQVPFSSSFQCGLGAADPTNYWNPLTRCDDFENE
jgi:hypothetical protein